MMANAATARITPIAMPAFAPPDRPLLLVGMDASGNEPEVAAAIGPEDVTDFDNVVWDGAVFGGNEIVDELVVVTVESIGIADDAIVDDADSVDAEALVGTPKTPIVVTGSSEASNLVVLKPAVQSQEPPKQQNMFWSQNCIELPPPMAY